ncbi:NO-inducible flavohemoprotein [Bacillus massilinigeriensis]|uniref:NO-inducible flavohemoprotein n=1 Tax=Bacillus massilionigeriensis TaxID=1805475 RepID=UPI00096B1ABF|nr:NO-inducible flavohemoprotein [Bacillus massilionigeriensis]
MLNEKTIQIIKSTVPVLEVHGEEITKRFYHLMFTNHPELLNIFNHANQKQGRQQRALANAVYHAAKYIDQLETILPVVTQIAHKHRSLGIKPEHYPIVGEHLILAIKDVLKEAATEDIIDAWTKAYGVIADAFIGVEAKLYEEAEEKKGGWKDFRDFVIAKKVQESSVITSFYLQPADSGELASFIPGQYISVKLSIPGQANTHIRQYSLSDSPNKNYYRISVKREEGLQNRPDGIVSNYLHQHVNEGDIIQISAPAGEFVLQETIATPIILLSGGVGITPMMSMLNHLSNKNIKQQITFVHAAINGDYHAFSKDVDHIVDENREVQRHFYYEKPTETDRENQAFDGEGLITAEALNQIIIDKNATIYMCGPVNFMQAMYDGLLEINVPKKNIHFEFFGPALTFKEQQPS